MRAVFGGSLAGARKIDGQQLRSDRPAEVPQRKQSERADKSVQPISFRDLAVMAFPTKTEANLAFVARVDARTARRWLADDNEPPAEALGIILAQIMSRYSQRR
jgi:hypothetical protein